MSQEKLLLQAESPFMGSPAAKTLRQLSYQAIDLAKPNQLTPERIQKYHAEACGFTLLFGTERVTDQVMEALQDLSKQTNALEKMKRMQDGEIVNYIEHYPSEQRAALHTATRDFFDHPRTSPPAQEAAQIAKQEIEKLRAFIAKIDTEKTFDEMILIGIGGSDLGPRAHYNALEVFLKPGRCVHFISNVDPTDAELVLKKTNLKRTLVVAISKSGTTLETATNEELVRSKFKEAGLRTEEHFISVTMPGTPMDNTNRYMKTFYMWDWVGGRFSTTSMCGAVILCFAFGFDIFWEFLEGAHAMDRVALEPQIHKNLPLLSALLGIWNRNFLGYSTLAVIPYSQPLHRYPAHLQQVEMESNGKLIDQQGKFLDFETAPIIWGEPGTNAQHSFFQLLHQSTTVVPILMIGFKKSQDAKDIQVQGTSSQEKLLANMFAQSLALALGNNPSNLNQFCRGNHPSHILLGEKLTPHSLGNLLAFAEHRTAFQGFIWGINSFDQEGVQLGKGVATKIIDCFAARHSTTKNQTPYPLGDAYLKFV